MSARSPQDSAAPPQTADARKAERDARRAAELRANLLRRKSQARAKAATQEPDRKP